MLATWFHQTPTTHTHTTHTPVYGLHPVEPSPGEGVGAARSAAQLLGIDTRHIPALPQLQALSGKSGPFCVPFFQGGQLRGYP